MKHFFTLLLVFLSITVYGQLNDKDVVTKDGKKCYTYTVKKGGTLFSVCKEINVPIDEVALLNPETAKGVREGQKLYVPITAKKGLENGVKSFSYSIREGETFYSVLKKFSISEQQLINANPGLTKDLIAGQTINIPGNKPIDLLENPKPTKKPDTIIVHKVLDHETLYNISKRFMVTVDELSKLNNNISSSQLKPGMTLRVPIYPKKVEDLVVRQIDSITNPLSENNAILDTTLKVRTHALTFLLPFNTEKQNDPTSAIATEFYMGAQIAIDSLISLGYQGKVVVLDAGSDSTTVSLLLRQTDVLNSELIIGPFNGENLELTAKFCKLNNIQLVSPIVATTAILKENTLVTNAVASEITLLKNMAKFIQRNYIAEQVYLVKVGLKDEDLYQAFRASYLGLGTRKLIEIQEKDIATHLKKGKNAVFVVPSRDRALATSITDLLSAWSTKPKSSILTSVGTKDWVNFDDISEEAKNRLNFHYASSVDFDISSEETGRLKKLYRKKYNTALTKYAVQGFDVTMYFAKKILLEQKPGDGVMNIINPIPFKEGNGFENRASYILKQDDYKIVKVGEIND
jgi:LysM repeat protein